MDRIEAMNILLTVVEAGSLSAAGRKLGLPLSTVSRKLSDLEAHLKARLVIRSSRQLDLTDAGRTYVAACRRILEDIGNAERAAAGEYAMPRGDLVLTAPVVFGRLHVVPVVTAFLAAYPQIDIRLMLADRVLHLLDDHVDVAVRIGALPDSSMLALRVGTIRRVVCASPAHLASHGVPLTPDDLRHHPSVAHSPLTGPERWVFGSGSTERVIDLRPRFAVNTAEAAIDAVIAGAGVTRVLSYQIAEAERAGKLVSVLSDFEPAPLPVSLVYAGQGALPQKLRAFLDFAAPRLRATLQAGQTGEGNG